MKKQRLKYDLEMMCAYTDELEQELEETRRLLGISNGTVAKQIDHIATFNRQLEQQYLSYTKSLHLKDSVIKDLSQQINELNDIIKQQEFMIARRDVIIRFLATGKADVQGEPIVKE